MGRIKDLKDKRFGKLLVLSYHKHKTKPRAYWKCLCDCGNFCMVSSSSLSSGNTKSCGCLLKEKYLKDKGSSFIDLSERRFGRLLVIEPVFKNKRNQWFYKCLCDCGNEKIIIGGSLRNGKTISCGCFNNEQRIINGKNNFIDITGNTYGKLIVKTYSGKNKSGHSFWVCVCECGKEFVTKGTRLTSGKTKSCGCLKESYISSELKKYFYENFDAILEYKILKNPRTGFLLSFDIYIPEKSVFIEVNGRQHYEYIEYFHKNIENFKKSKYRDKLKRSYAEKIGTFIEVDLRKEKILKNWISEILYYIP